MKIEVKSYSNVSSLLSAILFLIIGAVMFTNPDAMVVITSRIFGSIIMLYGIYNCIKNYTLLKKDSSTSSWSMIVGLVAIAFGAIFFFLAGVIEAVIRYVIGGWILFSGINRFVNALYLEKKNTSKFISLLIVAILLVIAGVYTILESNLAFQTIGLILIIYSVLEIFGWIFNKDIISDTSKKDSKKETKKRNNKEVVDAVVIEDKTKDK